MHFHDLTSIVKFLLKKVILINKKVKSNNYLFKKSYNFVK